MTRSHAFSRALRQLHVITLNFDWFTVLPESVVIGQSDYFSFAFTTALKGRSIRISWRQFCLLNFRK